MLRGNTLLILTPVRFNASSGSIFLFIISFLNNLRYSYITVLNYLKFHTLSVLSRDLEDLFLN